MPGIGMLLSVGFYSWLAILGITIAIYYKYYRYILLYVPIIIMLLGLPFGPANTYMRYIYFIVVSVPLLIAFTLIKTDHMELYEASPC